MKAVCWHGKYDMRVDNIPDPQILNPQDCIIKITSTAICGSDLHMYDGYIPTMQAGDVVGHEFMGEVVEVGPEVKKTKVGDRVIIPFTIACGHCWFCENQYWSCCDNSNPNGTLAEELYGATPSALFGYSHLYGGYAGGQAEYARVPFADVGPFKVPSDLPDEKVLFLTDILPTGWQAAVYCNIQPGDTVAVWGCGPVGQFAIQSAYLLGAHRVIAIDEVPERLQMAREWSKAETLDYSKTDVLEALAEMTGGRGPDSCIDAVGMEAHGVTVGNVIDRVKAAAFLATDRPNVLRQCIMACRKAGYVSTPGVYGGLLDKIPFGAAFAKGLTIKMGQTHVHKYLPELLQRIQKGDFDRPDHLISHRLTLDQAPHGYDIFGSKKENCTKIVMHPHG